MTFLELEKLCKKRKFFYYFKLFLLLMIIISGAGAYYFLNSETTQVKIKEDKNKTKAEKKIIKSQNTKNNKNEKLKLILDLNISSNIPPKIKKSKEFNKSKINQTKKNILKTEVLPSYQTCINLAKNYYKQGKYKLALKWAKNANIQNNKDPESWIVTAMSLYKLGDKKNALKILKIYYNYHKDEKVKKLLGGLNENNKK